MKEKYDIARNDSFGSGPLSFINCQNFFNIKFIGKIFKFVQCVWKANVIYKCLYIHFHLSFSQF